MNKPPFTFKAINTEVFALERSIFEAGLAKTFGDPTGFLTADFSERRKRAIKLARARIGSGHDGFLKGILVRSVFRMGHTILVQMMRYAWFEIVASQSKMVSILNADFVVQMLDAGLIDAEGVWNFNRCAVAYENNPTKENFQRMASAVPMGLPLWMGVSLNYLQIKTMVNQRQGHKLGDWDLFIKWARELPMAEELIFAKPKRKKPALCSKCGGSCVG